MSGLIRLVIAVGCLGVAFFYMIKIDRGIVKSFLLLRKAKAQGEDIAQGISASYKIGTYASTLFYSIIVFVGAIIMKINYYTHGIMSVFTIICIGIMGINCLMLVIAMFAEKNVYLTRRGLIIFNYYFDVSHCRFAWEQVETPYGLPNTLHVYAPDSKVPYTVLFDFDVDIAHRILDGTIVLCKEKPTSHKP